MSERARILVADDEPNLRRVLTAMLRRDGGIDFADRFAWLDERMAGVKSNSADHPPVQWRGWTFNSFTRNAHLSAASSIILAVGLPAP